MFRYDVDMKNILGNDRLGHFGSVEILKVNLPLRQISMIVHVNVKTPIELYHPSVDINISQIVNMKIRYLQDEGFIPKDENPNWHCQVTKVCNPI